LKTITIQVIDQPGGGVTVSTNAAQPHVGDRLTPAQALATDLLNQCTHRASDVRYWGDADPARVLLERLLDPDQFGHAVSAEVRHEARLALGRAVAACGSVACPTT
jgi:hypothetical protein